MASGDDPEAFAEFYRRHIGQVVGFLQRRLGDSETAADLAAEVFAAALVARRRYRPKKGPATTWLFAIARHKLIDAARRDVLADRARRKIGMPVRPVEDLDLTRFEDEQVVAGLLGEIAGPEREAVAQRVIDERTYTEIALDQGCSEQAARQRVSRGLTRLRRKAKRG